MKKILFSLLAMTACISTASLAAGPVPKYSWYGGLDLNASSAPDSDVNGANKAKIKYKGAFSLSDIKIGYRPESFYTETGNLRFEGELLGRSVDIKNVTSNGINTTPDSSLTVGAIMANMYYDIHTNSSFTPYIGAGAGIADVSFRKNPGLGITDKDSKKTVAAGQLMVGVEYQPELLPSTSWSLGYNLLLTDKPEFKATGKNAVLDEIVISSIQLGFKYNF